MHPERGIVCKYRQSDYLSTGPDKPNTLNRQCEGTNNAPKGPASGPYYMESCLVTDQIYAPSTSIFMVPELCQYHDHHDQYTAASRACPLFCQVYTVSTTIGIRSSALVSSSNWISLTFSDLIWLKFSDLIPLMFFYLIWLGFPPIWL